MVKYKEKVKKREMIMKRYQLQRHWGGKKGASGNTLRFAL